MKHMLEIILLIVLLIIAALSAASEIALISTSRLRLRKLIADGSKKAKVIQKILETPEKFFGTILVTNNVVDTLIASLVTAIMIALFGEGMKGVAFATIIATFFIIVFEVTAKTLAAKYPEKISLILAHPVKWLIKISSPVVRILTFITGSIISLLGGNKDAKNALISDEEVRAMIKMAEEDTVLHKEKYRMISRIFEFSETVARNVMTPKHEIFAINMDDSIDAIMEKALESGYSRLPVYKGTIDSIVGMISMKDLLNLSINKGLIVLQDIIYSPTIVPGTKKVSELLKDFQKGHTHLAIVMDGQGKMEGLVTLEDLLEEIVGEIQDESDVRSATAIKRK